MKLNQIGSFFWKQKLKVGLLLVVLAVIGLYFNGKNQQNKIKDSYTASRNNIRELIIAEGIVDAKEKADLYFSTPAKIAWVGVNKGDRVRKWQTMATLDRRSLEKSKQAALLDYQDARAEWDRLQQKYEIRDRKLDDVVLSKDERRELEKAQRDLDRAILAVEQSTLGMENYAMTCPIDGVVVETSGINAGQVLSAAQISTKSIRVVNPSTIYFSANVDEIDFGKIKAGQKAEVTVDAFGGKIWKGTVIYVGQEANKSASGSVKVNVEIKLDNTDNLVPNLNGEATIITNEKENVLTIPKKFVNYKNGKTTVLIKDGEKITEKEIKTGSTDGSQIEITEGLKEGDQVVNR